MIYEVGSKSFQRFVHHGATPLLFGYCEVWGTWQCPFELRSQSLEEVLFHDQFREAREALFAEHGVPESVLTQPRVEQEGDMRKPAATFLDRGGIVIFTPLQSTQKKDLLHFMASKYKETYNSSQVQKRLADVIEGPTPPQPSRDIDALMVRMSQIEQQFSAAKEKYTDSKKESSLAIKESAEIEKESAEIKKESAEIKKENTEIKKENTEIKKENTEIREKLADMQQENADLRKVIEGMQSGLSMLSTMKSVLLRKLIERCRNKCVEIISSRYPYFSMTQWNKVLENNDVVTLLESHGLGIGLKATRYGPDSPQSRGDSAAHVITEDRALYAEVVCSRKGEERKQLVDVYKFVFENSDPERDCFSHGQ